MTGAPNRPNCERPDTCVARGAGHCRTCHFRAVARAMHADPEFAAKHSAAARERMKAMHADPEFAAAARERMKAMNADPEFAAKHAARMKAMHADPEFAAKHSAAARERMKAMHADPEFAAKHSAAARERMKAMHARRRAGLGLHDDELTEWRKIRAKGFGSAEAARIVSASRKDPSPC